MFSIEAGSDVLAALGMSQEEFDLYGLLLDHPGISMIDCVEIFAKPSIHMEQLLGGLEHKGLALRSPERIPHYRAISPELAFQSLIAQRQRGLEAAQMLAAELSKKKALVDSGDELTVELVTGRDALERVITHIYTSVQHEVIQLDRGPYLNSYDQHTVHLLEIISRGATFQTIVDADALHSPGRIRYAHDCIRMGEQSRLLKGVPIKAVVIDRRLALLPLHLKDARESGLLLRPSLLLDLLCSHFDMLWEQSVPLSDPTADDCEDINPACLNQIIELLASGMKDKAVAYHMGISGRTLERRIAELQKQLHADSRFQCGWKAALQAMKEKPSGLY